MNSPKRATKPRLALHWQILIGLVLGVLVGVAVNTAWTPRLWQSFGVGDPKAYLAGRPNSLPAPSPELYRAGLALLETSNADIPSASDQPPEPIDPTQAARAAAWIISPHLLDNPNSADPNSADPAPATPPPTPEPAAALQAELARLAALPTDRIAQDGRMKRPPTLSEPDWRAAVSAHARALPASDDIIAAARPNRRAGPMAWATRFARDANTFVGDLFLRLLRFIAVPIVLFSLIAGAASLGDVGKLGRIGGRTLLLFLVTTALAIAIGLVLARYVVRPGEGFSASVRDSLAAEQAANAASRLDAAQDVPTLWGLVLGIVPENPFAALADAQMLQVVFAALVIGLGLTAIAPHRRDAVVNLCEGLTDAVIKVVEVSLKLAPAAVFALIAKVIADLGVNVLVALAAYSATVIGALAVVMFVVYPLTLILTRSGVSPRRFFKAVSPAQLLAFSSSSSGATLPVSIECCEKRLGVRGDIASFVLPLGATVNMNGTALYQGVAAVFISQLYGLELSLTQQLTIVLTATAAAIGTAAVPSAGIVMLVIVLQQVNIPPEGIAVILGVDRILDMCRTAVNVTGDCVVTAVVAAKEGAITDPDLPTAPAQP